MRHPLIVVMLGLSSVIAAHGQVPPAPTAPAQKPSYFILGADISFLRQMESKGIVFTDEGVARPGLEILRSHGYNWVRLRIMNEPTPLPNTLAYTLAEAKDAKALGFRLLLDFHYSDDWADPAHESTPKPGQSFPTINSSRPSSISAATPSQPSALKALCLTWCRSETRLPAA